MNAETSRDPNLHFVAPATAPRNPGRISPKTLLGPLGHPGPSADLLPDLLPLVGQEAQMLSGILALPTIPPPQVLRDMCSDVSKCTAPSAPQLCQANIPQTHLKHNMEAESGTPTEATLCG